ncbi:MAG: PIN domain-containing protein [Methanophagales archaeon ANME-1-THS]|nr:MAG: PIN domain-containing protein [Methanophagales archaeon ANME-1-THS]
MFYLDTDVILAYNYETEVQHWRAINLIKDIEGGKFYTSPFAIVELYCTVSRDINNICIQVKHLRKQKEEIKVKTVVEYVIRSLNLTVCSDGVANEEIEWLGVKVFSKYFDAIKLAPKVKLRTGDLLHVAYAWQLKNEGKIGYLVSLDDDFQERNEVIENETGIKLLPNNLQ